MALIVAYLNAGVILVIHSGGDSVEVFVLFLFYTLFSALESNSLALGIVSLSPPPRILVHTSTSSEATRHDTSLTN